MTATQTDATDTTADKLAEMLTENTGRSFLDSGDHYGRNWNTTKGPTLNRSLKAAWKFGNGTGN